MDNRGNAISIWKYLVAAVVFGGIFFLYTFPHAMIMSLSHDENQFVASAYLFSSKGLLPYLDYPYFHMPNLIFIYAGLFKVFGYPLLVARSVSALCAAFAIGLISSIGFQHFALRSFWAKVTFGFSSGLFLIANPLFQYTSGMAWNHDLPVLLTLIAASGIVLSEDRQYQRIWLFVSGLMLGVAAGARLAFLLAFLAFYGYLWIRYSASKRNLILIFSIGILVGLLPAVILFALDPRSFIFGNLEYARLNTLYRMNQGNPNLSMANKLWSSFNEIWSSPSTTIISLAFCLIYLPPFFRRSDPPAKGYHHIFWTGLILMLAVTAFLPSPMYRQYLYAPIPFLYMAMVFAIAPRFPPIKHLNLVHWFVILYVIVITVAELHVRDIAGMARDVTHVQNWIPYQVHSTGKMMFDNLPQGKVLTLAPVYVIEAGREIYPEFATGPFASRVADFLSPQERREFKIVSPEDLEGFLISDPPVAILIVPENHALTDALVNEAQLLRYQSYPQDNGFVIWSK